jgi:hypothetical protein
MKTLKQVLDNRRRVKEWQIKHPGYQNRPRHRYAKFKSKANRRGIELALSFDEWFALIENAECHYCHEKIRSYGISLDRKDSSRGYVQDNVVPCCGNCNRIRNEDLISYDEMLYIMPILLAYRKRQET